MNISGSASLSAAAQVANAPQVKVLNSQRDQLETVVGTLLEGVAETSQAVVESAARGQGARLSIKA